MRLPLATGCALLAACAGSAGSGGSPAAAPSGSLQAHGLSLDVPDGWASGETDPLGGWPVVISVTCERFVPPAAVHVARRPLTDIDVNRRSEEQHVTAVALASAATYTSFETTAGPEAATLAGLPAATITMRVSTTSLDGSDLVQTLRFYSIKASGAAWVVAAIGPANGAADANGATDAEIEAILASIRIE